MRIREFIAGPVTLGSLLVVLLLVGVATSVNIYLNPPPPQVEEEDSGLGFYEIIESLTWLNYTRFDIDYWYPEGMTLEELSLEGKGISYYEGGLNGYGDPNVRYGDFFLVWKPSGHFDSWGEALDYVIQVTSKGIIYDESQILEVGYYLSWQGHYYTCCMVNGTGPYADKYVGRFTAQECTETGRVFVYLYVNFEEFDPYDYIKNGSVYFATYRCHPIEGTPIEDIIG